MTTSSMLVGSYRALPDQTLTFTGPVTETVSASASYGSSIYLHHSTAALSLVTQVGNAVANREAGGACVLQQNGKIKISATSTFTLTWTSTLVRDLLGFTGNLSGANSYESTTIPLLLWIPGTTESPAQAVLGQQGSNNHDAHRVQAPDGTQVTRIFGSAVQRNAFKWTYIPKAYYQTTDNNGGELSRFFDEVLVKGSKFMLHRNITFDTSSTSTMTLDAQAMGPFEVEEDMRKIPFRRSSGLETVEQAYDFSVRALVTPEYAA